MAAKRMHAAGRLLGSLTAMRALYICLHLLSPSGDASARRDIVRSLTARSMVRSRRQEMKMHTAAQGWQE